MFKKLLIGTCICVVQTLLGCERCSIIDTAELRNRPVAVSYSNLKIVGLDRVNRDVVTNLLVFHKDGVIDMDASMKSIYKSGIFSDVGIKSKNGQVIISVKENATIEKLRFEGNDDLKDEMLKSIIRDRLSEGRVFNRAVIQDVVSDMQMAYRFSGYPAVIIEPKIIRRTGNKVDVVIEIEEGKKALVSKIIFSGNKDYGKEILKEKLETKERASWRLFSKAVSVFGLEKTRIDSEALDKFYKDEGYIDFRVNRIIPELDAQRKNTYLTVMLHEGKRFSIGNVRIESKSRYTPTTCLKCKLPIRKGDWYSQTLLEAGKMMLLGRLYQQGKVFVDIEQTLNINRTNNTVEVVFTIVDTKRTYIERIEIEGNTKTEDGVIRRILKCNEGDPQSPYEIYRAKEILMSTGYFSDVNIYAEPGSSPDRVVMKISVKESEDTDSISVAGTLADQDGLGLSLAYSDNNFRGRGQVMSSDIQFAQKLVSGTINLYEPCFIGNKVGAEIEIGGAKRVRKRQENADYKDIHVMPAIMYDINRNLSHKVACNIMFARKVWIDKSGHRHNDVANEIKNHTFLEDEYGTFTSTELSSTLTYRENFRTKSGTSGYSISLRNAYSGICPNTSYLKNSISAEYFVPCPAVDDSTVFVVSGHFAVMNEIKNVRGIFRFQPGGDGVYFRGFDTLGPRESLTGDCIGGLKMWTLSAQLRRPISSSDLGIFGSIFVDVGSVFGVPSKYRGKTLRWQEQGKHFENKVNDSASPRVSVGFSIEWKKCPLGTPVSFIFAAPLKKSRHDVRRPFTFGM